MNPYFKLRVDEILNNQELSGAKKCKAMAELAGKEIMSGYKQPALASDDIMTPEQCLRDYLVSYAWEAKDELIQEDKAA